MTKYDVSIPRSSFDALIDGEWVESLDGEKPEFLVYDCVCIRGQYLQDDLLTTRIAAIKRFVDELHAMPGYESLEFRVERKHFFECDQLSAVTDNITEEGGVFMYNDNLRHVDGHPTKRRRHANDGIIFTPQDNTLPILKWKQRRINTVDFRLLRTPRGYELELNDRGLPARDPRKKLATHPGENHDEHIGRVVECFFDNREWRFLRVHTKDAPNDLRVYRRVMHSIMHHLELEDLKKMLRDRREYHLP